MYTIDQLNDIIEFECKNLPINDDPKGLFDPIAYIMEDGGKRMRPLLTLLAANVYGEKIDSAIYPAISVEIFHNFTLLHDDIMDKAAKRRGRETVHVKWNDNTAILSGDAMLILSYQTLCRDYDVEKLPELMACLTKVSMEVCQGQQYDMEFETRGDVTIDEYKEMIRLKTAVLMAAALQMGAISQGAGVEQQRAIYEFGLNLGMAFQIQDDMLDTYGDSKTFGKAIGGDIEVGKQTFLMINAKLLADAKQRKLLETSRDFEQVKSIYDALDIAQIASRAIEEYFVTAIENLKLCSDNREKLRPLHEYAQYLMKRTK